MQSSQDQSTNQHNNHQNNLEFELKADGTIYICRNGDEITLTNRKGDWHKFTGSNYFHYGMNGGLYSNGKTSDHDIVDVHESNSPNKPSNKHVHYDFIVAWANGAKIEYSNDDKIWKIVANPSWHTDVSYRIKQEEQVVIPVEFLMKIKGNKTGSLNIKYNKSNNNCTKNYNVKVVINESTGELLSIKMV